MNEYRIVMEKLLTNLKLGKPRRRLRDNIQMDLSEIPGQNDERGHS
jgi:hypothetical protein